MAERYKRTRGVLLHRIGSFFRRLFGLKSKEQYLDKKKIDEMNLIDKDEPQRLTIVPETTETQTETKDAVEVKEVEEVVEEKGDREPEPVVTETVAAEVTTDVSNDSNEFENEDTFYSEY